MADPVGKLRGLKSPFKFSVTCINASALRNFKTRKAVSNMDFFQILASLP